VRRSPLRRNCRRTTRARSAADTAARGGAQLLQARTRRAGCAALDRAVERNHAFAELREFRASVEIAAGVRNGDRVIEHRIDHRQKLPGALV